MDLLARGRRDGKGGERATDAGLEAAASGGGVRGVDARSVAFFRRHTLLEEA